MMLRYHTHDDARMPGHYPGIRVRFETGQNGFASFVATRACIGFGHTRLHAWRTFIVP